jgi:hypothetical protein
MYILDVGKSKCCALVRLCGREKILARRLLTISLSVAGENLHKAEYSLREPVSAQGRAGPGFNSDPGRN